MKNYHTEKNSNQKININVHAIFLTLTIVVYLAGIT